VIFIDRRSPGTASHGAIVLSARVWRDKERANHINRLINSNNVVFSVNLSLAQTKVIFPWVPK